MADRIFAIDDQTFLFPQPVRDAYLADIQAKLNRAVTDSVANMPNVAQAVADKLAPLTADTAVTSLLTGSSNARAALPMRWLAGPGIDASGTSNSAPAVQSFLNACTDGDEVRIPTGAVLRLDSNLTISKRLKITGGGQLRFTGNSAAAAITVTASGTSFEGAHITTTAAPAQSGDKQYGIFIKAHAVRVTGCLIDGIQQGIAVAPGGEWHDTVIANNLVLNVPGSGDGPTNLTSNLGEDRGDGITSWGASVTITGNRVTAKDGTDARIGIHVEGLADSSSANYSNADAMAAISGNVVTGKFRRGIVSESVRFTTISGNSIADVTWWGIAIINTTGCVVIGNTVRWTRTSTDRQGAAWTPQRSAICVYGFGANNIVASNTVYVEAAAEIGFGISVLTDQGGTQDDLMIDGNVLTDQSKTLYQGIGMNGGVSVINRPRVINNKVSNFSNAGIYAWTCTDIEIIGNRLDGRLNERNAVGIRVENNNSMGRVDQNTILWTKTAVMLYNRNALSTCNNNVLYQAVTGLDFYNTSGVTASLNRFVNVDTKTTNVPTGAIVVGNS